MNRMKDLDITEGLSNSVWSSLQKAINSNSLETVDSFISFFTKVLRSSVFYKKFDPYNEFINFPVRLYVNITVRIKSNQIGWEQLVEIPEVMSLHLKEIIMMLDYGKKSSSNNFVPLNFYYQGFATFNDLLFQQAKFQDWNLLEGSLNRYIQLNRTLFNGATSKIIQLRKLLSNRDNADDLEIDRLRKEIEFQSKLDSYRRQPLTAFKYWLYFLADKYVLNEEHFNRLIYIINEGLIPDQHNEVEDILFFRTEDLRRYMGWENWDFKDRPENEIYSPPIASEWMTFGFVIDRLRNRNPTFITSNIDSKLKNTIPYLYLDIKKNIDSIKNNYSKWQRILRIDSVEELNELTEILLSSISLTTRSVVGKKEMAIAAIPLDPSKVTWFKLQMETAWKEQTRIRRIFDYFGNKKNVTGQDVLLKRVGTSNFLEKGKVHFIDGDYHMQIYGLNDFGAMVGRWENNLFFDIIGKCEPTIVAKKNLLLVLDEAFAMLKKSSVIPSAIILDPEYLYKDEEFIQSSRYSGTYKSEYNPDKISFFLLGEFDGIPIFSAYSPDLKDKVIISNFKEAFLMRYKTNDQWEGKELSVTVEEVSDEFVNTKYNENPNRWRRTDDEKYLSEDDAKLIIKNSVVIDVETIMDYEVKDKTQFIVGIITEPPPY